MIKYDENYLNFNLWLDFFYQYDLIKRSGARSVLEIGKGTGILATLLKHFNYAVSTVDIDKTTKPDYLSDIRKLPFKDSEYDVVCAFEVLEHIPFSDFKEALYEMIRVSNKYLAISLPYASLYLSLAIMPPQAVFLKNFYMRLGIELFKPIKLNVALPLFFLDKKLMHKGHCWEMGRGGGFHKEG